MPLATASQAVMPPKTLTNTACTVRVAQDDLQPVGHHLGRRAAADVEEVRRLDAAVLLAGVGDDVQGAHHQAGAVADDADLAVELDVVEVLRLGLRLERVGRGLVLAAPAWSGCRKSAFSSRVTLPSSATIRPSAVFTSGLTSTSVASSSTKTSQSFSDRRRRPGRARRPGSRRRRRSRAAFAVVDARRARRPATRASASGFSTASCSISMPPSRGGHRQVGAVGAVEQVREVVLLGDVGGRRDHHPVDGVALDVHAEDLRRRLLGLLDRGRRASRRRPCRGRRSSPAP